MTIIEKGMDLLFFGMGTVFIFLTLLVVGTFAMSCIISRFFAQVPESVPPQSSMHSQDGGLPNDRILKVIQDAVAQHRSNSE